MLKFLVLISLMSSQAWAKGSPTIDGVIQDYFLGYQRADTSLIQNAFHPQTKLLSVTEGQMDVTAMEDWLKSLEERRRRGDIRLGKLKVEAIDITQQAASVKLQIRFQAFEFTDYLSLLKIEGEWLIVGKIYHFREI
ncbi:MAG TPA: nuclear transport factor 2 family protein [Bacteriovoracaceae bacterium]|nr:nuclear transport factor 2 family protein [Bacteriovoracaceae bacterium]